MPAGGEIAEAQTRDRLDKSRMGEIRFDRQRFERVLQRLVGPVKPPQRRRAVGKERRVFSSQRERAVIGGDSFLQPIEPHQSIATIAERISVIGRSLQQAIETGQRLSGPAQIQQRHAAAVEQLRIVGNEPQPLLVACQRAGEIPQRQEDETETGETFGPGEIAFQRFLKTH